MKTYIAVNVPWFRIPFPGILSETVMTVSGKVAVLIVQFLGIKVLTTMMPMAEYGNLSVLLSASMIANLLFYGPFGQGCMRFLPIAIGRDTFASYERAIWKLATRGTALSLAAALLVAALDFTREGNHNLVVILCVAILAGADGINISLIAGLLNAHRKRGLSVLVDLLDKLKYLGAALAIYQWGGGYQTVVGSFVIMAGCLLLLNNFLYKATFASYRHSSVATEPPTDYNASIRAYSHPFMIWGVFTWAQVFLERYTLEQYYSTVDVAAYAILNQFGFQTVSVGGALLMQIISPILFRRKEQGITSTVMLRRSMWGFVAVMVSVLLVTTVYASYILAFFTADKYKAYADWLPWMMVAGILFTSGQILSLRLMVDLEPRRLLGPKLSAALVEIGLLVVLVPDYGIGGVISSSIAANAVYCGGVLRQTQSKMKRYEVVH